MLKKNMSERFKFRIWDKKEKKMYNSGDSADFDFGTYPHYLSSDGFINRVTHRRDYKGTSIMGLDGSIQENYIIQQSTGLKDKNGKLIYEGDILKCEGRRVATFKGFVKWCEKYPSFDIHYTDDIDGFLFTLEQIIRKSDDIEIIGNIYENPELLTKDKD